MLQRLNTSGRRPRREGESERCGDVRREPAATHAAMEELRVSAIRAQATDHAVLNALAVQLSRLGVSGDDIGSLSVPQGGSTTGDPLAFFRALAENGPSRAETFADIVTKLAPEAKDELRAKIKDGQWIEAVDRRNRRQAAASPVEKQVIEKGVIPTKKETTSREVKPLPEDVIPRSAAPGSTPTPTTGPSDIAIAIARANKIARRADALGTVISFALLSLFYAAYLSGMTITSVAALAGVFFQAFSIDIGVGALVSAARRFSEDCADQHDAAKVCASKLRDEKKLPSLIPTSVARSKRPVNSSIVVRKFVSSVRFGRSHFFTRNPPALPGADARRVDARSPWPRRPADCATTRCTTPAARSALRTCRRPTLAPCTLSGDRATSRRRGSP